MRPGSVEVECLGLTINASLTQKGDERQNDGLSLISGELGSGDGGCSLVHGPPSP